MCAVSVGSSPSNDMCNYYISQFTGVGMIRVAFEKIKLNLKFEEIQSARVEIL